MVDLQEVLRLVREVSPRLAIERQAVAGAEANRITAGAYPNPSLSYGYNRPSGGQATLFTGSRQQQGAIDLPLLIGGQRAARVEKAELELEAARARVASGASTLAAEAGSAFVALLAAQEKFDLLAVTGEELLRLRDIVAGREASGMASRYDLARLDVELGSFRTRRADAEGDVADRAGNLAGLLGLRQWRPRASGRLDALPIAAPSPSGAQARAAQSPAVIAAIREERAAESGIELAQRERTPAVSINAGRAWTSEPFGAANVIGFSVEIPVLDTRLGPLEKARSDARAASLRRELVEAETAASLERFAKVIAARQAALQRFEQEASARLPALKQMAEDAYRLGRGSIFELLDSTRSRHELQQQRIDLMASLSEARLRYLAASGGL